MAKVNKSTETSSNVLFVGLILSSLIIANNSVELPAPNSRPDRNCTKNSECPKGWICITEEVENETMQVCRKRCYSAIENIPTLREKAEPEDLCPDYANHCVVETSANNVTTVPFCHPTHIRNTTGRVGNGEACGAVYGLPWCVDGFVCISNVTYNPTSGKNKTRRYCRQRCYLEVEYTRLRDEVDSKYLCPASAYYCGVDPAVGNERTVEYCHVGPPPSTALPESLPNQLCGGENRSGMCSQGYACVPTVVKMGNVGLTHDVCRRLCFPSLEYTALKNIADIGQYLCNSTGAANEGSCRVDDSLNEARTVPYCH